MADDMAQVLNIFAYNFELSLDESNDKESLQEIVS